MEIYIFFERYLQPRQGPDCLYAIYATVERTAICLQFSVKCFHNGSESDLSHVYTVAVHSVVLVCCKLVSCLSTSFSLRVFVFHPFLILLISVRPARLLATSTCRCGLLIVGSSIS